MAIVATTIAIDPTTRERLRRFGHAGMSYDEILRLLMDRVDRDEFVARIHAESDAEQNWVELDDFDWGE